MVVVGIATGLMDADDLLETNTPELDRHVYEDVAAYAFSESRLIEHPVTRGVGQVATETYLSPSDIDDLNTARRLRLKLKFGDRY